MSSIVLQRDVASLGTLQRLTAPSTATAASTGDSTTTTGVTIDRAGFSSGGLAGALAAAVIWGATLATGKTLSIGYAIQDSADGVNFSDFQTATYAVVATGSTAASAMAGSFEIGVNLLDARRYVRLNYAVDLSATQTDTAVGQGAGFFAGFDRLPQ
jgi:hypothetical protein